MAPAHNSNNMILSVKDRVILPGIFKANQDSMTEASVQRSIRELATIGEIEAKYIELQQAADGRIIWNALKADDKEIAFDGTQLHYLRESVYNLSKSRGVTQDLLPLCEKIQGATS